MIGRVFHAFAGTRPEVVKLAPVVHELRRRGATVVTVATGQQSDPRLTDATFAASHLTPDVTWELAGSDYFERAGALYANAVRYLAGADDQAVAIVQGDTTTVPLVAHAARRAEHPVIHVEAGLRSLNQQSLEETNRKIAAAIASVHFAPTDLAASFLRAEGVAPERVFVVGNTACDALRSSGVTPTPVAERSGAVVTAHRATNVDDPARLAEIVDIIADLAATVGRVLFPVHPRTRDRLEAFGLFESLQSIVGLELCGPLPYDRMLAALSPAKLIVTDSGGLQEEAAWFGVPCVVMRQSTPRWEGVANGTTILTGVSRAKVGRAAQLLLTPESQRRAAATACPYGDGHTASRIADVLTSPDVDSLLDLREPDYTGGELPTVAASTRR